METSLFDLRKSYLVSKQYVKVREPRGIHLVSGQLFSEAGQDGQRQMLWDCDLLMQLSESMFRN
jgi:hypothetical protein